MEQNKKPNVLERIVIFMENDPATAKVVSYGITTTGLIVALLKVRPFAKFKRPSDLPTRFLQKRVPLQGTVMRIEPSNGTLLMVDHKPLISIFRLNRQKYLPVKMAGLNVTANGISWLHTVLSRREIKFVPVSRNEKYVDCIVTMPQKDQECLKVGEQLVRLGFAKIEDSHLKSMTDKEMKAYRNNLMKAQKWAERRRNGYWHFEKQPTLSWKLQMALSERISSVLPTFVARVLNI